MSISVNRIKKIVIDGISKEDVLFIKDDVLEFYYQQLAIDLTSKSYRVKSSAYKDMEIVYEVHKKFGASRFMLLNQSDKTKIKLSMHYAIVLAEALTCFAFKSSHPLNMSRAYIISEKILPKIN